MIDLVPMTDEAYHLFLDRAVADYAQQHVQGGRWSAAEANEESRKEFAALLPNGVDTPDTFLYTIADADTQTPVGMLWYTIQEQGGKQVAFIYNIEIDEAFRRRGYASAAFHALEQETRAKGLDQIRLHVFGHNHGARALYEKLGYETTNVMMAKSLDS